MEKLFRWFGDRLRLPADVSSDERRSLSVVRGCFDRLIRKCSSIDGITVGRAYVPVQKRRIGWRSSGESRQGTDQPAATPREMFCGLLKVSKGLLSRAHRLERSWVVRKKQHRRAAVGERMWRNEKKKERLVGWGGLGREKCRRERDREREGGKSGMVESQWIELTRTKAWLLASVWSARFARTDPGLVRHVGKHGRRSPRKSSWRNFIVDCSSRSTREIREKGKKREDDKTEVGKLNLLCDTLRARVSTNAVLFFTHFRDVGLELFQPLCYPLVYTVWSNSRTIAKHTVVPFRLLRHHRIPLLSLLLVSA